MKKLHIVLTLGLALGLSACNEQQQTSVMQPATQQNATVSQDSSPVLATVNGTLITQQTLDFHMQQRNMRRPGDAANQDQNLVLQEVINLELMNQAAEKAGIDARPEIATQLQHQRRAFLAGVAVQDYITSHPVTDEETQALYQQRFGSADQEYKARHILLKSEEDASKVVAELDQGGDFAELAKQHSTGPTGPNGGDLGWFSPAQMVQPFSEAVAKLEKGQYTKAPVQTQFGWHVILLEDSRESTPPAYEDIKDQLQMVVQNQRLQQYLQELREAATVDVKETAAE